MPWLSVALLSVLLAAVLSPARLDSLLPAKAEAIRGLFAAGIQMLRAALLLTAVLSTCSWVYWKRWGSFPEQAKPEQARDDAPAKWSKGDIGIALMLGLIAAVLRLPNLADSLWWDEINTLVRTVKRGLPVILAFSADGNNHLLNSVGMYVAAKVLGESEWALRVPAFLLSILTPVAAYLLLRRFLPRAVAAGVGCLLAVSFPSVVFGDEARGYAGGLFFALISMALFVLLAEKPSRPLAFLYPVSAACAVGFLAPSIYLPVAHALTAAAYLAASIYKREPPEVIRKWGSVLLVCAWGVTLSLLLVSIQVPQLIDYSRHRSYSAHLPIALPLLSDTLQFATGARHMAVSIIALIAAAIGWSRLRRPIVLLAFLGPIALPLLAFWLQGAHASPRLFAPVILPICLGLALLIMPARNVSRTRLALAAAVFIAVVVDSVPNYVDFYTVGQPRLRELAREIPGKETLLTGRQADMNVYYFPAAQWNDGEPLTAVGALPSAPEYVLAGFDCVHHPTLETSGFGYQRMKTLGDWATAIQDLHPGHTCFDLYVRRPDATGQAAGRKD